MDCIQPNTATQSKAVTPLTTSLVIYLLAHNIENILRYTKIKERDRY